MAERRQAHRREPIEVEVRERVFEAHPLPWLRRNNLGNEIMSQYADLLNSSLRAVQDGEDENAAPRLEMYLNDKISDPVEILRMGYPNEDVSAYEDLDYDEIMELIYATLEVNQLESLRGLVDPNWHTPTNDGGIDSAGEDQTDTQNQQSSPDSDSPESQEQTS